MKEFLKKHTLITGTLLLTATGLLTRVLGFFYRIFLSRTIGAEGLGLYNMIHPLYGICFALCAGSIQTALSRFVATNTKKGKLVFRIGLVISFSISLILAFFMYRWRDFLATYILMEPRCAPLLTFMAVSVPFSAVHACINGYYYGMQKTSVPACAQMVEQVIRIGAVFLLADIMMEKGIEITVQLAVLGHLIGEMASALYTVICFSLFTPKSPAREPGTTFPQIFRGTAAPLMALALPLMGNRLVLNLLSSAEAIWIPNRLLAFGLSDSEAFSVYGVLTGMAMPFIFFPSAISSSLAVLLLPSVSQAQAAGNTLKIRITVEKSMYFSLYLGILFTGVFLVFGKRLGLTVFHNASAGTFITILAWLCPFLYLCMTIESVLNGLGKTSTTFINHVISQVIALAFILIGIPRYGILACLWGSLASQLLLTVLHLWALRRLVSFSWNAVDMILKPCICAAIATGVLFFFSSLGSFTQNQWITLAWQGCLYGIVYVGGLVVLRTQVDCQEG